MVFDAGCGFTPERWNHGAWLSQTSTRAKAPTPREVAQTIIEVEWPGLSEQAVAVASRALTYRITRLPSLRLKRGKFLSARIRFQEGEWIAESADLPLYGSGATDEEAREMLEREIESLWDDLNRPRRRTTRWENIRALLSRVIVAE